MKTVYKYPLPENSIGPVAFYGPFKLQMPRGAKPLLVAVQNDNVCLWAEVEVDQPVISTELYLVGTGKECPAGVGWEHVGSYQRDSFVWHVYMRRT
jgi:hypothetical protein